MKRWQKLLLVLLLLFVCTQIPFAYRRYRLGRLNEAIRQINAQRRPTVEDDYVEYKGVVHVHSFLGGHSAGTFDQIITAAKLNQLDFVVMTEHTQTQFNTAAMTLKGLHNGILFVNGNEVAAPDGERLLVLPGDENTNADPTSAVQAVDNAKSRGALAIVAYPNEFKSWSSSYDGIEVYNLYSNARKINPLVMLFDGLWSYRSYPDLLFATFYERPAGALQKWDEAIAATGRQLVGTAGNDAHANVGMSLNDSSGKTWIGFKADPYERSFRLLRMHVLVSRGQPLSPETLLAALAAGHCFIGSDLFGDTTGFRFLAENGNEKRIQGEQIALGNGVRLSLHVPVSSRVVLLKDGKPIVDENGISEKTYQM